jgi:hypothetical protein
MTATAISPSAASAREKHRNPDGKFGTQPRAESAVDFDSTRDPVDDADRGGLAPIFTKFSGIDRDVRAAAIEAELHDAVAQVVESGHLARFLELTAANRIGKWSFGNQILATFQGWRARDEAESDALSEAPGHLMVMSAHDWKTKFNRHPRAGASAIWILAPVTKKFTSTDEKTGEEESRYAVVGFTGQAKFDACQTTGDPIPEQDLFRPTTVEPEEGAYAFLTGKVAEAGYTFHEEGVETGMARPDDYTGRLGYTSPKSKKVAVAAWLPESVKIEVVAHELAHIHCGHVDGTEDYAEHRGRMETEAEAAAYMVMRALGREPQEAGSFAAGYIASWSKGDKAVITKAMAKASTAFRKITETDADKYVPDPNRPRRKPATRRKPAARKTTARPGTKKDA